MNSHSIYHVVPVEEGWEVQIEGANEAIAFFDNEAEALEWAREEAASEESADVRIHERDFLDDDDDTVESAATSDDTEDGRYRDREEGNWA